LDRIWAPWRGVYIDGTKPVEPGCIFCNSLSSQDDRKSLLVHRGHKAFVIMNLYPYNNGHVMVAPKRHIGDLELLADKEAFELFKFLRLSMAAIRKAMESGPDGFNIGMNIGRVAGAGVPDHLHFHVVPRWNGDVNFMPVLAETRVISEHLDVTYEKLIKAFSEVVNSHAKD